MEPETVTSHFLSVANEADPHFAPELAVAAVVVYVITALAAGAVAVGVVPPPLQLPTMVRPVLVVVVAAPLV